MGRPLEMRGWAVKHTALDGEQTLSRHFASRKEARAAAALHRKAYYAKPGRYTVVPVVVRERR